LAENAAGPHVLCSQIDTSGSLIEMTLHGNIQGGKAIEVELMVPSGMVRMIVSAHSEDAFGFNSVVAEPQMALPVLGPTASPEAAVADTLPHAVVDTAIASAMSIGDTKL